MNNADPSPQARDRFVENLIGTDRGRYTKARVELWLRTGHETPSKEEWTTIKADVQDGKEYNVSNKDIDEYYLEGHGVSALNKRLPPHH